MSTDPFRGASRDRGNPKSSVAVDIPLPFFFYLFDHRRVGVCIPGWASWILSIFSIFPHLECIPFGVQGQTCLSERQDCHAWSLVTPGFKEPGPVSLLRSTITLSLYVWIRIFHPLLSPTGISLCVGVNFRFTLHLLTDFLSVFYLAINSINNQHRNYRTFSCE